VALPQLNVTEGKSLAASGTPLLASGKIVLEEFVFEPLPADLAFFTALPAEDRPRLAVLDDSDYTHFVRHATEVTARIKLNHDTKTVDKGALFYQEFLPAETLLYSLVLGAASRKPDDNSSADAMMKYLFRQLPEYLQIGGDETTGKGICRIVKGGA
jgi:CRISPR-associated protein Cmr4